MNLSSPTGGSAYGIPHHISTGHPFAPTSRLPFTLPLSVVITRLCLIFECSYKCSQFLYFLCPNNSAPGGAITTDIMVRVVKNLILNIMLSAFTAAIRVFIHLSSVSDFLPLRQNNQKCLLSIFIWIHPCISYLIPSLHLDVLKLNQICSLSSQSCPQIANTY